MRYTFLATRLDPTQPLAENVETVTHHEVPLENAHVTRALNGPGGLTGTLRLEDGWRDPATGGPILLPWRDCIWAEEDGRIRSGGVITQLELEGDELQVTCMGLSGYADGQPWTTDEKAIVGMAPEGIQTVIWNFLRSVTGGRVPMQLGPVSTPFKLGTPVGTGDGPYLLNRDNTDLGAEFAQLADTYSIEYRDESAWAGQKLTHTLRRGHPRLGAQRNDLRFAVGENVMAEPRWISGEDFANYVLVLGSGDGKARIAGAASNIGESGRLRRAVAVTDSTITTSAVATAYAQRLIQRRRALGDLRVTQIQVWDHPNARINAWDMGDVISIVGQHRGIDPLTGQPRPRMVTTARIISDTVAPDGGHATLTLIPEVAH